MNKILDLKCPGCGSRITHDPIHNNFHCKSCSNTFTIEQIEIKNTNIKDASFDKYKCNNCGAEITVGTKEISTKCDFCGNTAIVRGRLLNEFKPDYIVPFKTKKSEVKEELRKHAEANIDINLTYFDNMEIQKITPMYMPYFLHSFNISASVNVQYYDANIKVFDNREKKVRIELNNVPIDGSVSLDDDMMMNLYPFNLQEMLPFNPAYLSGHNAEMYDEPNKKLTEKVVAKSKQSITDYFMRKYRPYAVQFKNTYMTTNKSKYSLIPV